MREYSSPTLWPGDNSVRDYRLRLDEPELEWKHGMLRRKAKYLSPPERFPMLYFVPGTLPEFLQDSKLPIIVTEGEKKCLALSDLAWHGLGKPADRPRWLSVAIGDVWSWKGKVGRTEGPNSGWFNVKGSTSELECVEWQDRIVTILFDLDVATNDHVQRARRYLTDELQSRGAHVRYVDIPTDSGVKGVDDLVG